MSAAVGGQGDSTLLSAGTDEQVWKSAGEGASALLSASTDERVWKSVGEDK
jgi:hypothetical protein